MPRVFVLSSHGSVPVIDEVFRLPEFNTMPLAAPASKATLKSRAKGARAKGAAASLFEAKAPSAVSSLGLGMQLIIQKPYVFKSPVDIFTTTKCGHPFCADLLCDPPYMDLVSRLSSMSCPEKKPKAEVRKIIEREIVNVRDAPHHARALTRSTNRIRCHKMGRDVTELYLFAPSFEVPIIESVSMVDMETGEVQDVHERFGLVEKKVVRSIPNTKPVPLPSHDDDTAKEYVKTLNEELKNPSANPFYLNLKKEQVKTINATLANELKESKFEYSPDNKKYGEQVKLSDILQIGILNGTLNPETDFVVVYACRVPDRVPYQPGKFNSPREDSDASVGGWSNNSHKAKTKAKTKVNTKVKPDANKKSKKYKRKPYRS